MASKALPSPEVLRQLLRYDPETGKLFWRERNAGWFSNRKGRSERECKRWNGRWAGIEALAALTTQGYKNGSILGRNYRAHRVIWAMQTEEWPTDEIDHANGKKSDNRWVNLRHVDHFENAHNKGIPRNNTSGAKGVCFDSRSGKWLAQIRSANRRHHIGYFACFDDAKQAVRAARASLHGQFARHE